MCKWKMRLDHLLLQNIFQFIRTVEKQVCRVLMVMKWLFWPTMPLRGWSVTAYN